MNFEEQGNNKFRMTISDPELIEKIRESGIESLTPDDINSLGVEAKNGQLFFRDASAADPDSDNRIKLQSTENKRTGSSPLRRGLVGFIAIMVIVLIALSAVGIYLREKYLSSLAKEDIVFISLYAVVGLAIALSEFRTASAAKKYLTERVQGKCISLEYREKNGVRRPKKSIYEYTYKGETYRSSEKIYANKGYAKIGEVRELMISPESPWFIYDPKAGKNVKSLALSAE